MTKLLKINREGKTKLTLSLLLVVYALFISIYDKTMEPIVIMLMSCFGDISIMASRGALTGKKENTFETGILCFSMAHFGYVSAMGRNPVCMIITMSAVVVIYVLINKRPSGDKLAYIPYTIALVTSAVNAWLFSPLAGIGMILFLISDLVLSIFENKDPKWQIVIWVTYVSAQICMLTAILLQ